MSQAQSHGQDPTWVVIHIAKFSHNLSPSNLKNFTWSHVSHRDDLDLVLQNVRVVDDVGIRRDGIVMKITAGADVMETQELGELVDIHREYTPCLGSEHPVEVVIKDPFLAMRYPKPGNMIRRIQIKFNTGQGFGEALATLSGLGFPITNKNAAPVASVRNEAAISVRQPDQRPISMASATVYSGETRSSSPSPALGLARSLSSTPALLSRGPTPSMGSFTPPPLPTLPSPLNLSSQHFPRFPVHTASSPLKYELKLPTRPVSSIFESTRPALGIKLSEAASNPLPVISGLITREGDPISNYVPTPSIYISQLQAESRNRSVSLHGSQISSHYGGAGDFGLPDVTSRSQSPGDGATRRSHCDSGPSSTSRHFPLHQREPMALGSSSEDPFSGLSSTNRLTEVCETSYIHDDWIPPKRELPFKRPQSVGGTLPSSVAALPPLPKPTLKPKYGLGEKTDLRIGMTAPASQSTTTTLKPASKKRVAQRKPKTIVSVDQMTSNTHAKDEINMDMNTTKPNEISPLALSSVATLPRPFSAPMGFVSKTTAPPRKRASTPRVSSISKRAKMIDQSTQTSPSIENDDKPADMVSKIIEAIPGLTQNASSSSSPPDDYMDIVDQFVAKHKERAGPSKPLEIWKTPGYDDMDEEQRMDMINDYLCKNLDNPQFIQLCEDVEHSWRRIGLL